MASKKSLVRSWSGRVVPLASTNTGWTTSRSTYEGASMGRRTAGWNPGNDSVNTALFGVGDTLRARSRDMIRKNAWANNGSEVFVSEAIGTGIKPQSQHPNADTKEFLQKMWTAWTDYCDAQGTSDFYGLQALSVRSMIEGGECFVRVRFRRLTDGFTVPFQLQLLESEHCPATYNEVFQNGNYVKAGVEFNPIGQRVAYWMYPVHPGENNPAYTNNIPVRIPASQIYHLFRPLRPGQVRGEPWLSRALVRLYDYDQYTDADLMRKKVAALFAGFIIETNPDDPPMADRMLPSTDGFGTDLVETPPSGVSFTGLEPGTLQKLRVGEDIKFADPAVTGTGFKDFNTACLREIAAAIGVTYEQLTGDLTGVNYSSIRAGLLTFRRRIEQLQHAVIVYQFCRPVWTQFLESAVFAGAIKARTYAKERDWFLDVKWITQGWQWVDPKKELDAAKDAVRCGFKSKTQVVSEQGYDIEDVYREIAHENQLADDLGIVVDTDPRRTSDSGMRPSRDSQNPDGIQSVPETFSGTKRAPITPIDSKTASSPNRVYEDQDYGPMVHVTSPNIRIEPPNIVVNTPAVNVHPPPVNVRINGMGRRIYQVSRDERGRIAQIQTEDADGVIETHSVNRDENGQIQQISTEEEE